MTVKEACKRYFETLCEKLKDTHEVVGSCNKDASFYLVPKGTAGDITYYGKPVNSYRLSDHWNWYSNTKKCRDRNIVQCHNVDLPRPSRRCSENGASKPVYAWCVARFDADGRYHTIFAG